jgi:peptidase M1-like protein
VRRLLAFGLVACAAHIPPPPVAFPQFAPFRLPHTFEPARYRARLAFHPWWFSGHIEIDGTLATPTDLIWLHGVDLDVHHAHAVRGATRIPLVASPPRDDETIALVAHTPLPAGRWTLELDYAGPIRDHEPKPAEKSAYYNGPLEYRALGLFRRGGFLFTQSEPIYARRIFPCIDEPDRKVPWQLTLDVSRGDIAASNAPIARTTRIDATHQRVEFAPTLPLPSYLIAFAVGPFQAIDVDRARVLVRPGQSAANASVAAELLARIEAYTDIRYPYPKLDLVAVPELGLGAMENPGLITIDEKLLGSVAARSTIAHELAHQWFGNLVTPRWWDDIWLNESFATWMTDKLVDPGVSWPISDGPVRAPAGDTEQLSIDHFSPFERIDKGAQVLAGLDAYLGEDSFRATVRRYLAHHMHGSVTTADFAAELHATEPTLDATFAALLEHAAPVLEAHLECGKLVLAHPLPWPMPVCIAYDHDGRRDELCAATTPATVEITLPASACPAWAMPNPRGVALHKTIWTQLLSGLVDHGWPALSIAEQHAIFAGLRSDGERFRVIGKLDGAPLEAVSFLESIERYAPDDLRASFLQWIEHHFGARASTLHLADSASPDWRLARLLAHAGDPRLLAEATSIAGTYRNGELDSRIEYILPLAARDASFASRLLADAAGETRPVVRRWLLYSLLGADVGALVQREPAPAARLSVGERVELLQHACTNSARTELAKLTSDGGQFVYIDQCLAEKQRLEPAFRAWLEPIKSKLRK